MYMPEAGNGRSSGPGLQVVCLSRIRYFLEAREERGWKNDKTPKTADAHDLCETWACRNWSVSICPSPPEYNKGHSAPADFDNTMSFFGKRWASGRKFRKNRRLADP